MTAHASATGDVAARWSAARRRLALAATAALVAGSLIVVPGVRADPPIDGPRIDAHVRAAMDAGAIPGVAVAVVRDGEIAHLAAFGQAGPGGTAMTADTPVVIGSVGKSITALAIRQLVEAGRVDLGSSVTRYLPWFALAGAPEATERITVGDLLGHTSGVSTADGQDPRWYAPGLTSEAVARAMTSVTADRPVGTYEYSNLNYAVLGVVIEAVSGQSYGEYLRDHVFGPLGMDHSSTSVADAAASGGLVQGHRYLFGLPVAAGEAFPTGMVPAGYQVSTARDLGRFVAALSNGGVAGGVDVLTPGGSSGTDRALVTDWGRTASGDADLTSSQSGATLVTNADILEMPGRHLGVVVLMNANPIQVMGLPAGAAELALDVANLSLGREPGSSAPSVRTVYLVLDALLLALLALLAVHVVRVRTWARRLATAHHRRVFLARAVVADLVLPLLVLVGLPLAIGATGSSTGGVVGGWTFLLWTLPDLGVALLILAVVPLVVGAAKVAIVARPGATVGSSVWRAQGGGG